MKRAIWILGWVTLLTLASSAQALVVGYNPRTGDIWVDTQLADMNRYGQAYGDYFIDDIVRSFGAPRYLVRELYYERRWLPADIYYACAIAYFLDRPCLEVVTIYEQDRGQGWGAIAQRLGIKPGSEAFHRLKDRLGRANQTFKHYAAEQQESPDSNSNKANKTSASDNDESDNKTTKGKSEGKGNSGKNKDKNQ